MPRRDLIFRVFVSSTFSDLIAERNALQERVFPRLRDYCLRHGARFQAVDLRWGVSEEAALDQQTMNICLQELKRCQKVSPRPNFIVLLGDRYGWRPLPPQVPADEFGLLLQQVDLAGRGLLKWEESQPGDQKGWFRRDDNAVPAEYVLQPRHVATHDDWTDAQKQAAGEEEAIRWRDEIEPELHRLLREAARTLWPEEDDPRRDKYEHSATHQEIQAGALEAEDATSHVFCYFRSFARLPQGTDPHARKFVDLWPKKTVVDTEAHKSLSRLKAKLDEKVGAGGHIYEYRGFWNDGDLREEFGAHCQGIDGWTAEGLYEEVTLSDLSAGVEADLKRIIDQELAAFEQLPELDREIEAHREFADDRARHFIGRDEVLQRMQQYATGGGNHPLVVHGPSGSGKSAVMAKAVLDVGSWMGRCVMVARFIGATPGSSDLRSLLESLCRQIGQVYGNLEQEPVPSDVRELMQDLPNRLALATAARPLVVFLDALDQLRPADGARYLGWLPRELPPHARLIVSVLESEGPEGDCFRATKGRTLEENGVPIAALSAEHGEKLLDAWLAEAGRSLQAAQRAEVLGKFVQNGLPLYLKLAFEEARRWRSYDPVPDLAADTPGILEGFLSGLETAQNHGQVLTSRALGYLAAGRSGLTEDELLDVLSADQEVMKDFRRRAPRSPEVQNLPAVLWSRLYAGLERYLTTRRADGTTVLSFYHRQVGEAVVRRYLAGDGKTETHAKLGEYFHRLDYWLESLEAQRARARRLPPKPRPANQRKVGELAFHRLQAQQWDELEALLTDLHFLEAKTEAGRVFDLARDFTEAVRSLPSDRPPHRILRLLEEALQREIYFIARHTSDYPQGLFQSLWNSGWWYDRPDAAAEYVEPEGRWNEKNAPWLRPDDQKLCRLLERWRLCKERAAPGFAWLASRRPPPMHLGTAQRAVLRGHEEIVRSVAFSPDGDRIASGSNDHTVRVWDAATGQELAVLRGHEDLVRSVAFSPDGDRIASGGGFSDRTVRMWDARTGAQLAVLRGHEREVNSVAFSPHGDRILSGSFDGTIRVWDARGGTEPIVLRRHEDVVRELAKKRAIAESPDIRVRLGLLVPGPSWDDILSGAGVNSVAWSPNGAQIVSAWDDGTVRVWDTRSGTQLLVLRGHRGAVHSVAFSPDGRWIISGSGDTYLSQEVSQGFSGRPPDNTVRVWDACSGVELAVLRGHKSGVASVAFSPRGDRIVSGGSGDRTVRVWDARSRVELAVLRGHEDSVESVAFSPRADWIVSGSWDKTVRVWDATGGSDLAVLPAHKSKVTTVTFSPDGGRIASRSLDHEVRVWDARTGAQFAVLGAYGVAFSPGGDRIAGGCHDHTVRVWDARTGQELALLRGHVKAVGGVVAFSPAGDRIVSDYEDGTVRVWDAETGVEVAVLRGHERGLNAVAFAPDGRRIATASDDGTVRVWDVRSGAQLAVCWHEGHAECVAFSPGGDRIASGSRSRGLAGGLVLADDSVRVWDAQSGEKLSQVSLRGERKAVTNVAFSSDGDRIVARCEHDTVLVFDVHSILMDAQSDTVCGKVVRGSGDVRAIAVGVPEFPFWAIARGQETVVERADGGEPVAWFPVRLDDLVTHPSGHTWAGAAGSHLYIITLEGAVPSQMDFTTASSDRQDEEASIPRAALSQDLGNWDPQTEPIAILRRVRNQATSLDKVEPTAASEPFPKPPNRSACAGGYDGFPGFSYRFLVFMGWASIALILLVIAYFAWLSR